MTDTNPTVFPHSLREPESNPPTPALVALDTGSSLRSSGMTAMMRVAKHHTPPRCLSAPDAGARAKPTNACTRGTGYRIFAPLVRHDGDDA
ncbi:hypothetical protein [Pseudovibrio sp. Tun.PSC04-5.I4]|uniref:hypothetical protein n=1 Tax=Pseudovibrio sp. Tun.PSC04-5.I4 TaxID=1798213 RepID=UPI000B81DF93|nr:hypothetical protein [Pseudovibrio sp. Tun.PSC04-5.I4]